ncbi:MULTISPECIES: hypothetical protein [Parachlamydia]|jgi:hypothetical protein|uniref:hypothetical protein n=1 Tax=Parachlamydia TaxID=83551 RepID=UPI0024E1F392|nr:hypothetical protein [Parachlamydia acanthamoebae]
MSYPAYWYPSRNLSDCEKFPEPCVKYNGKIPVYTRKKPYYPGDKRPMYEGILVKHANRLFKKMEKADTQEIKTQKRHRIIEIFGNDPDLGSCFGLLEIEGKKVVSLTVHKREVEKLTGSSFLLEMEVDGKPAIYFVDSDVRVDAFEDSEYMEHTDKFVNAIDAPKAVTPPSVQTKKKGLIGLVGRIMTKIFR